MAVFPIQSYDKDGGKTAQATDNNLAAGKITGCIWNYGYKLKMFLMRTVRVSSLSV